MNSNETVPHIHPRSSSVDNLNSGSSATRRPGPPRFPRRRRHEIQSRYIKLLVVFAGVTALILLVLAKFTIEGLESENQALTIKFRKQAIQIDQSEARIKTLRQDIRVLVQERIPNLHPLAFDETITLNQQYLRDIIFTLTGVGSAKEYEYRVVLQNDSLETVHTFVKVFLFDRLGIQLGMTRNSKYSTLSEADFITLQPGEIRSYSSKVPVDRNETPHYFLVTTE